MVLQAEEVADNRREHGDVAAEAEGYRADADEEQRVVQGHEAQRDNRQHGNQHGEADDAHTAYFIGQRTGMMRPAVLKMATADTVLAAVAKSIPAS